MKKIENKKSIFIGLILGLLLFILGSEIFQYLTAILLKIENVKVVTNTLFFSVNIPYGKTPSISYFLSLASSYLFIYGIIELFLSLLKKKEVGFYRFAIITLLITIIGCFLINYFYGVFMLVLNIQSGNDFFQLISALQFNKFSQLGIVILSTIVFITYINLIIRRVQKYISFF